MKLSDYVKKKGISYDTAGRMWNRGQLQGKRLSSIRRRTRKTECLIKCLEEEHEISSKTSNQI
ncbi:MAG: hypothetical protein GPJ01_07615 [Microcystis aeruginosa LL13-06]|nr:hypothetical protein [Microcystis aeruginosa LL13-06]